MVPSSGHPILGPARGEPHTVCARRQPWYDGGNRSGHDARPKMATAITSLWLFRPSDGGGACAHNRTRRERRPGTPDRARGPAGAHRGRRIVPSGRGSGPARREWWAGLCWTRVYETKSRTGLALRAPRKNSGFDPAVSRRAAFEEGKRSVSSPFGGKMVRPARPCAPEAHPGFGKSGATRSRQQRFGADDVVSAQTTAFRSNRRRLGTDDSAAPEPPSPPHYPTPASVRGPPAPVTAAGASRPRHLATLDAAWAAGAARGPRADFSPSLLGPSPPRACWDSIGSRKCERLVLVLNLVESRPHAPLFARRPSRPAASAPPRREVFRPPWLYPSFAHSHHSQKRDFEVKITIESDTGREVFRLPSPGVSGPTARLHSVPPRPCRRDRSRLPVTARGAP